jgi:hypothetical protein
MDCHRPYLGVETRYNIRKYRFHRSGLVDIVMVLMLMLYR